MTFELLILQGIIERGLIFALIIMAIYLTSRILHFDDLTMEGSFGLGGALTALLLTSNIPWPIALVIILLGGACAGLVTGILHTKLKLNNLISGIVVTTALFSINLKIAGSQAIINNKAMLFNLLPANFISMKFLLLLPIVITTLYLVKRLLNTEFGFLLKAVGDNPQMLINLGKNPHTYKIAMLALSNAITALSGALFVHYVGYFSIWASVGILIIAIAGLILSEIVHTAFGVNLIIGAIIYQAIIAATFEFNVDPEWNKLITALLIISIIALKRKKAIS